jgi:VIT1/CCC1 family predicted Fe2+/Mn2+ transporter
MYRAKGLSESTAAAVARELTNHGVVKAHVEIELGLDPNELTNPWHAAVASAVAFLCGAIIPIAVVVLSPAAIRIPMTFAAVLIALIITGALSAHAGEASKVKATIRVVLGGMLAMAVTFGIGKLFRIAGV